MSEETERQQLIPNTCSPEYPVSQGAPLAISEPVSSSPPSFTPAPELNLSLSVEPPTLNALAAVPEINSVNEAYDILHCSKSKAIKNRQADNQSLSENFCIPSKESHPIPDSFYPEFRNVTEVTQPEKPFNVFNENIYNGEDVHGSKNVFCSLLEPKEELDGKEDSKSRLSASPDFWRRVSPQLIYIDSSSFGGSHRSGSINSSKSAPRDRSNERETREERNFRYHRGRSIDCSKEQETKSIDCELPPDSTRSVTWNLEKNADTLANDSRKNQQPCVDKLSEKEEGSSYQELVTTVQNKAPQLHPPRKSNDGFLVWLRNKISSVRSPMHYDEDFPSTALEVRDKISIRIDKPACPESDVGTTTAESQKSVLRENTPPPQPLLVSTSTPRTTAKSSVPVTCKAGEKSFEDQSYEKSNYLSPDINAANEKDDSLATKPETKAPRGKLKRYFSLDSSPVNNLTYRDEASSPHQSSFLPCPHHRHEVCSQSGSSCSQGNFTCRDRKRLSRGDGSNKNRHSRNPHYYQNQYYMEKDLRYYFQHPWFRLFVAYLVIFCNFLLFAEDPLSHSHTESNINVVGNVFSFVATKYPKEWYWKLIKVVMWVLAVMCGMLVGKVLIHGLVCKRVFRLKMFRHEQGSWMCMFLTVIVSMYMFSYVYNLLLLIAHPQHFRWQITSAMGVTNQSMMKAAATCTWLGDLVTALMVTDMMLQDRLYPHWGTKFRRLYNLSNIPRILIFWVGSIVVSVVVIFLIVSDYISWEKLNQGFVETTELSRAFLASFILVMDLLIVMQDWDFPHFTSTVDVNLPGFSTHTLHWRWAKLSFTGKWFNYGIIFMVMIFDLNMWKNQLFYIPEDYGQYIDPVSHKVYIVEDDSVLATGNRSLWSWEHRSQVHPDTGKMLRENDPFMYSRWMGYSTVEKCTAFIPNLLGMTMFFTLITLYGRFPPNQDGTYGGRLKKRPRSSWRRERRSVCERYCTVDQECPQSMLGDSLYRGSKCPNCVYLGTKCMSRCSSSQPDFKEHYSDPALERSFPMTNDSKLTETDEDYESHRQYTVTQHSDPGVLEGRSTKGMHFCQSLEYRDMRMLEKDMKSKDHDGNEECGTPKHEISTEDNTVSHGLADLDLANDFTVNVKKRTPFTRKKNLLQNYLSQKCSGILSARQNRRGKLDEDETLPKRIRSRIHSKGEEDLEPVHEQAEVELHSNLVTEEQLAAASIKSKNIKKRNVKLSTVRFFDRRKKKASCMESTPPHERNRDETKTNPVSCASSTLESHGRVFFGCPASTEGTGKIDSTDAEGVLFIKSKCETGDVVAYVPDNIACGDSEHSSSSENLNRINFGSNPSVNL